MGWSLTKKIKGLIKMVKQRPDLCVLLVSVLFALFRLWIGLGTSSYVQQAKPPTHVFNETEFVYDVYTGNLETRDYIWQFSEVSFVFYYAPWCRKSMLGAAEFGKVAREMHHQISFIAVNCWWNKGECRKTTKNLNFPLIQFYHRNKRDLMEYKGPHLSKYYKDFLKKGLNSVVYLGTVREVDLFINANQISVILYCERPKSFIFKAYVEIALTALEKYPHTPLQFGVILSKTLSSNLEIKRHLLNLYDSTRSSIRPVSRFSLEENTSPEAVIKWATNHSMALQRIYSIDEKSNALHKVLKYGPTLITFGTSFDDFKMIDRIAVRYNKHQEHGHCCKTFQNPTKLSVCLKNSGSIYDSSSCELFEAIWRKLQAPLKRKFSGNCFETLPLFDMDRNRLEICSLTNQTQGPNHVTIDGLAHQTNMTLRFVTFDYELTPEFAHVLGFLDSRQNGLPFTVIVDLPNEQNYVMTEEWTSSNLEQFILNYTNHMLTFPQRYLSMKKKKSKGKFSQRDVLVKKKKSSDNESSQLSVPNILSYREFEEKVLSSKKDVLLYYHAAWCGGCMECSHALLELKIQSENVDKLLMYQINEPTNHQLPLAFKAISYPTIILYPGNRTSDSVLFSSSCSRVNLIDFLLHNATPSTKAQLLLDLCKLDGGSVSNISHSAICKQQEVLKRLAR